MTVAGIPERRMSVGPLPGGWARGGAVGQFEASGFPRGGAIPATVRVFEPLDTNPDYLLRRFGAQADGPLGRPTVESLPESLAEGVSIVAFNEEPDGTLIARIDLMLSSMLELLAAVHPIDTPGGEQ